MPPGQPRGAGPGGMAVFALVHLVATRSECSDDPAPACPGGRYLVPGTTLTDAKRRHQAMVRADGSLNLGQIIGSIHKVGALAQGLPACNGWTFWHVEKDGKLICIDDMRSEMRAQMREA